MRIHSIKTVHFWSNLLFFQLVHFFPLLRGANERHKKRGESKNEMQTKEEELCVRASERNSNSLWVGSWMVDV